ncbi:MAG TPA: DUF1957 domain-containing protein [Verrucomicrobiota bacterium]|nr:DUF1957 domain-containing protein [Verrucomicrobiota bacterium]HNU52130.1 DUF1957 domain-containing protein [Verrucomicrobiota bacterium]
MGGHVALVLHAHLPFVRHPEHEQFLEESWLFEAMAECYLPLLTLIEAWGRDRLNVRLALTLSPTLCSMLLDPLLQARFESRLEALIDLAERECFRTHFEAGCRPLAEANLERFRSLREAWHRCGRDLVGGFRRLQEAGRIEIITCAATHALLPLLAESPLALRGQVFTACDHYRSCFGRDPVGIWLPECGYVPAIEPVLREANLRWFIVDTDGLLRGSPRPRYGTLAPVFTPEGLAVFGRDRDSARQVWSRGEGYPGDPRYRDFYRDIGFDLDYEYVRPYLPSPNHRGFTGVKYHAITGGSGEKRLYDPAAARRAAEEHAAHFCAARAAQLEAAAAVMDRPPLMVAPYDAELFGHWWHEGLWFLDAVVRQATAAPPAFGFLTPTDYLRGQSTLQVVRPCPSSWGEGGYFQVWVNEKNAWIQPHLRVAEGRLAELVEQCGGAGEIEERALRQAARELMLAQASDWPFILTTGTNPEYAGQRVTEHLARFQRLCDGLTTGELGAAWLAEIEALDGVFPAVDPRRWRPVGGWTPI